MRAALSLLLFLASTVVFAQTEVASMELSKRSPLPDFMVYSPSDQGLVTFGNMTKRSSRYKGITKYDLDFNKEWSKQVIEQNGRKNIDFVSVLGDQIFVFTSEHFPRESSIRTYYTKLDLAGNIVEANREISSLSNEKEHRVDLSYVQSYDKRKLLCYKNLNNADKNEKIIFTLFDANGGDPQSGELDIPYPDDKFNVRTIQLSNSGNVYVVGKRYKVSKVREPDDFNFMVIRYDVAAGNYREISIDIGDFFLTDLTVRIDRDEMVYAAGFYSEKNSSQIIGTVYQKINNSDSVLVSAYERFDDELLSKFLSDKQIGKGQELKYFFLDNIVLRSDGGVLLLAEKYYTTYNSYRDIYGLWIDEKVYHYDEIIVTSISNTGEIEWSAVVPKRQASENRMRLSYTDVITGGNINLVYETKPKKLPRSIYLNRISIEGEVSQREGLFKTDLKQLDFYPTFSRQTSNDEAILFYYNTKGKKYVISKMVFE